jgi:cytochrome bd-type quinol oxidase subunit 2
VLLVAIVALSLGPDVLAGSTGLGEELLHAAAYAILTASILIVWNAGRHRHRRRGVLADFAIATALALLTFGLGVGVEMGQGLVGRDAEWSDIRANAAGVALALATWSAIWLVRLRDRTPPNR